VYNKSDGDLACGIYLKGAFNFSQAEEECNTIGGHLPQIQSEHENDIISKLRVIRNIRILRISHFDRFLYISVGFLY